MEEPDGSAVTVFDGKNPVPYRACLFLFCLCPPNREAMFRENTVILLEQSAILWRESVRQCIAMLQGPGDRGPVVLDVGGCFLNQKALNLPEIL